MGFMHVVSTNAVITTKTAVWEGKCEELGE